MTEELFVPDFGGSVSFDPDFLPHVPTPSASFDFVRETAVANWAFFEVLGHDPLERPTLSFDELGHQDARGTSRQHLLEHIRADGDPTPILRQFVRSDGSLFWGQLLSSPLRSDIGAIRGLHVSIHELPAELLDGVTAGGRSSTTEAFVASVGHELRSPLHSIVGLAELLADTPDLTADNRDLARAVLEQASTLGRLVDDLLDYSKIYGSAVSLDLSEVSPTEVCRAVLSIHERKAAVKDIDLQLSIDPKTPARFVSDRLRVQQILTNLVGNAVRYSDAGVIEVRVDAPGSNQLRFVVADNGPGIDVEFIPSLFEPFTQGHQRLTGSGLGLAIVKRLTTILGGSIGVESTPGSGSAFTVLLPLTTRPRQTIRVSPAPTLATQRPLASGHVMVVEDEAVNQLLATSQLTKLGYLNTVVDNGREALELLEDARSHGKAFVAVLMDWHLPGMDGLETTRRLRATEAERPDEPHVPVIGLTANAMLGDREKCLTAGMDEFLAKPVSISQLADALETWICPINAAATEPLLDKSVLEALSEELGDTFGLSNLLETFLAELPARLEPIRRSLQNEAVDSRDLHRAVHSLKSTSALIGSPILSSACAELESFIRGSDHPITKAGAENWFKATLRLALRLENEVVAQLAVTDIR